ncbi:MAG: ABC transporter substrate-binding protein [Fervidicoccaceae archaeon]|jgi:polar amino acid transport system substrate-binding protein|nr:ABC transporter substrate-binding protein [Fervidicoccaceae archaeon]
MASTKMVLGISLTLVAIVVLTAFFIYTQAGSSSKVPSGKFSEKPSGNVTVIVGLDPNYPPFTFVTSNGTVEGFDVDLMTYIGNYCGFTPVFKPWDWATIVTALMNGDIDVIASGMTITAERSSKIAFSIPYYSYRLLVVTKASENRSLSELLETGSRIAVETGSDADRIVESWLNKGYKISKVPVESYPAVIDALVTNRADLAILDSAFLYPYLDSRPELRSALKIIGDLGVRAYGIATRPDDYWLRNCINRAIEEAMSSTVYSDLLSKWGLNQ